MQFDVIIPTRGTIENILSLLSSIDEQTVLPQHIFLIVDKHFSNEQECNDFAMQACGKFSERVTSRLQPVMNTTHDFVAGRGASYVRNYGIKMAKSPFVYLIDDDNILDKDFFERSIDEYEQISQHGTALYSPTIGRRKTIRIQSVGLRQFHYRLSWPEPMFGGWKAKIFGGFCNLFRKNIHDKDFYFPQLVGGNSLLGKTSYFKELLFDERMPFIFEDIDLTYRRYKHIGPIAVSKNNVIHHMEREKTKLEQSFIATADGAYEKAKNRILFVKNNANKWQRIQFFGLGLWFNTLRFSVFILVFAHHKTQILSALRRGVQAGLKA